MITINKALYAVLITLYFSTLVFAIELPGNGISLSLGYENGVGIKQSPFATISLCSTQKEYELSTGISIHQFSNDYTASIGLTPLHKGLFSFGLQSTIHYGIFHNLGSEFDLLGLMSITFQTHKKNPLTLRFTAGVNQKYTYISALKSLILCEGYPAVEIYIIKELFDIHTILFKITSYEYFYYPIFMAPVFSLGYTIQAVNSFDIGVLFSVRYTDMMTLTATIDGIQCKIYMTFNPWEH